MRPMIHLALATISALVAGCGVPNDLADPMRGFHTVSMYGSAQHVRGNLQGMRADPITGMPAPAAVPYTENVYEVGSQFDLYPAEKSVLGTSLGMMMGINVGYVSPGTIGDGSMAEGFLPIRAGVSTGTGLALLTRPGMLLSLHSSIRLSLEPDRLGDTGESLLVVYVGARGYIEKGGVRTHVGYDFMPFWTGESRLEHRLSALFSTRPREKTGYGVRATLAAGQKRLDEGGLNDLSFTIGLEMQK